MYVLTKKENLKDYINSFYGLDFVDENGVKSFKVILGWCGTGENTDDEFIHVRKDELEAVKNFLMTLRG